MRQRSTVSGSSWNSKRAANLRRPRNTRKLSSVNVLAETARKSLALRSSLSVKWIDDPPVNGSCRMALMGSRDEL